MIDVPRYLARLDLDAASAPGPAALAALHDRHLITVPFENFDIHLGREIVLDVEAFFEKLVVRRRGGFCYELNGLFGALLESLGYVVEPVSARVYGADGPGIEGDHMALLVTTNGERFLADVGFGESFRRPLPFVLGAPSVQLGETYRLVAGGDGVVLELFDRDENEWRPSYTFAETPRTLEFFAAACRHHQTSPDSPFVQRRFCTKAIPDGRVTLREDALIVTRGGKKAVTPLPDAAAWSAALERHFGVRL